MVNLRPVAVIALAIGIVVGVPVAVDLIRFIGRERAYRRFRRDFEGRDALRLREDWTSAASNSLRDRLIRQRGDR